MATGRKEWKETGEELGGAFKNLAKSLIRTGTESVKRAEEWANEDDDAAGRAPENEAEESTVFNDGSWRETGKSLGKAFASLGSTIMGSVERGADKAEEWANEAKETCDSKVEEAAEKAEKKADDIKRDAHEFAEGLREADRENEEAAKVVADAEIVSEEIIE